MLDSNRLREGWCTKLDDLRTFIPGGFPFEDVREILIGS